MQHDPTYEPGPDVWAIEATTISGHKHDNIFTQQMELLTVKRLFMQLQLGMSS